MRAPLGVQFGRIPVNVIIEGVRRHLVNRLFSHVAVEPLKGQVAMRDAITGAHIAVIDGNGYEMYADRAEAYATAVLKFVESLHY